MKRNKRRKFVYLEISLTRGWICQVSASDFGETLRSFLSCLNSNLGSASRFAEGDSYCWRYTSKNEDYLLMRVLVP